MSGARPQQAASAKSSDVCGLRRIRWNSDENLELEFRGVNHEPGNIFMCAPRQRTLMLVDVIFPGWGTLQEPRDVRGRARGWLAAHGQALT